jgi:hypothetical protein
MLIWSCCIYATCTQMQFLLLLPCSPSSAVKALAGGCDGADSTSCSAREGSIRNGAHSLWLAKGNNNLALVSLANNRHTGFMFSICTFPLPLLVCSFAFHLQSNTNTSERHAHTLHTLHTLHTAGRSFFSLSDGFFRSIAGGVSASACSVVRWRSYSSYFQHQVFERR